MRVGVPKGLFYYRYKPFIEGFFNELNLSIDYGENSGKKILDLGSKCCVDEACLPMKLYHGHVKSLSDSCDFVAVPRLMKTEFGESICPKFCGLPELVGSGSGLNDKFIFTQPIVLNQKNSLKNALNAGRDQLGCDQKQFNKALASGLAAQRTHVGGYDEDEYRYKVFLGGHPYNIYDSYANLNLIKKLHTLDIGVITEERVSRKDKELELIHLLKRPYWTFFVNIYGAARALIRKKEIDGIICVSSFSCGTDSFTVEMLKNEVDPLPMLVLKLDEQTGEAGYDTRLEAFQMILETRKSK